MNKTKQISGTKGVYKESAKILDKTPYKNNTKNLPDPKKVEAYYKKKSKQKK